MFDECVVIRDRSNCTGMLCVADVTVCGIGDRDK